MANPEIGKSIQAGGVLTNYHDVGEGRPVLFIHGSGPGVSAWANWRLVLPLVGRRMRALAPDMLCGVSTVEETLDLVEIAPDTRTAQSESISNVLAAKAEAIRAEAS